MFRLRQIFANLYFDLICINQVLQHQKINKADISKRYSGQIYFYFLCKSNLLQQPLATFIIKFVMNKRYKDRYTFEQRVNKVKAFKESDQDKVLIIVEKHPQSQLPDLSHSSSHSKSLNSLRLNNQFGKRQMKNWGVNDIENNNPFSSSSTVKLRPTTMESIYERCKETDGILYVTYQEKDSFGLIDDLKRNFGFQGRPMLREALRVMVAIIFVSAVIGVAALIYKNVF